MLEMQGKVEVLVSCTSCLCICVMCVIELVCLVCQGQKCKLYLHKYWVHIDVNIQFFSEVNKDRDRKLISAQSCFCLLSTIKKPNMFPIVQGKKL